MPPENKPKENNSDDPRLKVPDFVPAKDLDAPHNLRTYQSDMAEAIKSGQATVVKIALAEQKKKNEEKKNISPTSRKNVTFIIAGLILLALGAGVAAYFLFFRTAKTAPVLSDSRVPSIVYANEEKGIDTTGLTKDGLIAAIQNEVTVTPPVINNLRNVYFTEAGTAGPKLMETQEFLKLLASHAPETLLRTLDKVFMVGVFTFNGAKPFVILSTNTYDTAGAGMLSWEGSFFDDWYSLFGINTAGDRQGLFQAKFADTIIKNRDARAIKDADGNIVIFYTFLNEGTILIAEDANTLSEIIDRLTRTTIKH